MAIFRNILGVAWPLCCSCFYMSYFIVNEKQKALVLRFGDINRIVEEPGLYFKLPIADTVTMIEDRIMVWEMNNRPVQDIASQVYIVDAITWCGCRMHVCSAKPWVLTLNRQRRALRPASMRPCARPMAALVRCRTVVGPCCHDGRDRCRTQQGSRYTRIKIVDVRVRRTDLRKTCWRRPMSA